LAGVGRSSEVRTDEVGVSEGECGTWGDCMRVELAGDVGRGEDIVAMASYLRGGCENPGAAGSGVRT
jgi:hypothetical protein